MTRVLFPIASHARMGASGLGEREAGSKEIRILFTMASHTRTEYDETWQTLYENAQRVVVVVTLRKMEPKNTKPGASGLNEREAGLGEFRLTFTMGSHTRRGYEKSGRLFYQQVVVTILEPKKPKKHPTRCSRIGTKRAGARISI